MFPWPEVFASSALSPLAVLSVPVVLAARAPDPVRVLRGGSWFYSARFCRSAYRFRWLPVIRYNYIGFRVGLFPGPSSPGKPGGAGMEPA